MTSPQTSTRSSGYAPPSAGRPRARQTPRSWWVVAVLSFLIALYALSFLVRREDAFPPDIRDSFLARPWGIYTHVLFGGLALLIGPFQFRRGILARRRALHRNLGKVYLVSATLTGIVGLYMAVYSFGGINTHLGFGILGVITAAATITAYTRIRACDVKRHREWMIRSFALIFAAVTLRIELPLLIIWYQGEFAPAYAIVSWLAWVPNLIWAEWYIRHSRSRPAADVPTHSRAIINDLPSTKHP
jgi:uncharacterized membrane protein